MKKIILLITILLVTVIGCSKEFYVDVANKGEVSKFNLQTLDGKKVESTSILNNGKPTLFIVAAEWCPHCKEEAPEIERFYNEYRDKVNVMVVYSNVDSSLDAVKNYIKNNGYTFPAYYDEDGTIMRGFGVTGFPFNLKIENSKVVKELKVPYTYDKMIEDFIKN